MFLEKDVNSYIVDSKKKENTVVINRENLLKLKELCKNVSKTPWEYYEEERYQQFFSNPLVTCLVEGKEYEFLGHGLQLAKIPKKESSYAEYWFTKRDADFIIAASKWMLPLVEALLNHYPPEDRVGNQEIDYIV